MTCIDLPAVGESRGQPRRDSVASKSMRQPSTSMRGSVHRGRTAKQPSLTALGAHSRNHVIDERRVGKHDHNQGRQTRTFYPTASNLSFIEGLFASSPPSYEDSIEDSGSYPNPCDVIPPTPSIPVFHYSPAEVSRTRPYPDSPLTAATLRHCSDTNCSAVSYNGFSVPLSAEGRSPTNTIKEERRRSVLGQWNVTMKVQIWRDDGHKQQVDLVPDCDDVEVELAYKEGWTARERCGVSMPWAGGTRHVKVPWIRSAQNFLRSWFDGKSSGVVIPAEVTRAVDRQRSFLDMKGSRSSII